MFGTKKNMGIQKNATILQFMVTSQKNILVEGFLKNK